ncbi:LuxR C-terminal-related transcriptional regulator [Hydrocarboniclastica marina]|uniref:HTH luxR-type domain-containing protein n=1 Tax=Hydrocarboniclastica marina TaxID=2259620 RepID=A0A4P7XM45_9ALTE|nr:LuxR C-terminal-related transcriptional regulator [Hydrocarboniclastica marina]QCF27684.1 hypothetical protein soil367_18105 [Hydrocarboniclastica marina]
MHGHIIRNDLLEVLGQSHRYALTVIMAPAGSGKTSLLGQWRDHSDERSFVMLRISARDRDPMFFLKHFLESVRKAVHLVDVSTFDLFADQSQASHVIADTLLAALEGLEGRLCIVLDDFQHIDSPLIHDIMAMVLERLPDNLNIVISTRRAPDFSLSQLRLENRLLTIDGNDLRLERQQINQLSITLGGERIPEQQLERLYHLTEGWAAGVKLALISYARSGAAALDAFSGNQPEMVDYFCHVVLKGLCEPTRAFLIATAIFERFNSAVCDHVFQSTGSARFIELFLSQGTFVTEVEGRSGWCRYHGLLRDFLCNRIAVEMAPEATAKLHARAAGYFLQVGDLDMALSHAKQSGDDDYCMAVLEHACEDWAKWGKFDSILSALGHLKEDELLARITLAVPLLHALIFSRRFNEARYYLETVKASTHVSPMWKHSSLGVLELCLQLFEKETEFFSDLDATPLMASSCHKDIRAFSSVILAYYLLQQGDLASALRIARQAKVTLAQTGYIYLESYADLIMALCDRSMGRTREAVATLDASYLRLGSQASSPAWVNIATGMVVVHYEQNQLDKAKKLCQELLPHVDHACATEIVATVYISLARLLHLEGNHRQSSRLLDQLSRILLLGRYDRFQSQVALECMRQAVAPGLESVDLAAVDRVARAHGLPEMVEQDLWRNPSHYRESTERYGLTAAYWLMARGDFAKADQILAQIQAVLDNHGVHARSMVAACNRAQLRFLRGDHIEAVAMLQDSIKANGLRCFSRSLFDETPGLENLVQFAAANNALNTPALHRKFADLLAPELYPIPASPKQPYSVREITPKDVLTLKEREILHLLQQGLTNSAISEATGAALSTTKWHLKNIYQKPGVSNRTAAIVHARSHRL